MLDEADKASIAFLTGDNESALVAFRNAQKLLRASPGKRKVAFEAEAGRLHAGDSARKDQALRTELRSLIDAAMARRRPSLWRIAAWRRCSNRRATQKAPNA